MRPPKTVLLVLLAALGMSLGLPPRPAQAGPGTLAFNPSQKAVTVDGQFPPANDPAAEWGDAGVIASTAGIESLFDGTSTGGLSPRTVKVFTKFDAQAFYVAFKVDDNTATGTIGDKVLLFLDPTLNKGANPAAKYYLVDYTVPRGGTPSFLNWSQGTFAAGSGITWATRDAVADNVQVAGKEYIAPVAQPGYVVEIRIPFAAVGYNPGGDAFPNLGVAFVVLDDDGFVFQGQEAFTGVGFPDDPVNLPLNDAMLPAHLVDQSSAVSDFNGSNWNTPSFWGTGVVSKPADRIFISQLPVPWESNDIKTAFCTASSFADAGFPAAPAGNPKWYQYQTVNPCKPLRMFSQIHRQGGLEPVNRRVLYVWAENGANPQKWFYINVTDPPVSLAPGLGGATTDLTLDAFDWNGVPAGELAHPCVQAIILPETLNLPNPDPNDPNHVFDLNFLKSLGSEASATNTTRFNNFRTAYGLTTDQWGQMNIELLAAFTCPVCGRGERRVGQRGSLLALDASPELTPVGGDGAAHVHRVAYQAPPQADAAVAKPPPPGGVAVANFTAFGTVRTKKRLRYTILEPLGGVQKVIDVNHLKAKRTLPLHFNVSNSLDFPREIFVVTHLTVPKDAKEIGVRVNECEPTFRPGEKKAVVAQISYGGQGGYGPPPSKKLPDPDDRDRDK